MRLELTGSAVALMADRSEAANCSYNVLVGSHLRTCSKRQLLAVVCRCDSVTHLKLLAGSPMISVVVAVPSFSRFKSRSRASKKSLSWGTENL